MNRIKREERTRTLEDKIISTYNDIKYSITEPYLLKKARKKNQVMPVDPFISVYCPTYNRCESLIGRAIPSVLAQTYRNFEFIIVGVCCTDDTIEVVSKIPNSKIRLLNLNERGYRYPPTAENHWFAGPVVAANKALELCSGEYIARIDDDDIWTPDHLEKLLGYSEQGNYEFVSSQYIEERYGQQELKSQATSTWMYRSYLKFFKYNINCWRKQWNKVNDKDFLDRVHKAGVRVGCLPEVTLTVKPRKGEDTIGIDAYCLDRKNKQEHYKF